MILNVPLHPVLLTSYGCIYLDMTDYETKNETHVGIEYEQESMAAALISTLLCTKSCGRRGLGRQHMSSAVMSEIFYSLFICNK